MQFLALLYNSYSNVYIPGKYFCDLFLTKYYTNFSNIARVRIVSDYYGENLNNKFKLRYQFTNEPANFKGHSNDSLKTEAGGFVVRQSAISSEKRVSSGPEAAPLSGRPAGEQWGKPPKPKTLSTGIRAQKNGRTAIRSGKNFRPAIKVKSAVPKPTEYVHVPPPNPDDVRQGYVYTVSFNILSSTD